MPLHLFDAFGIELEYMIVDADTLGIRPLADSLLAMMGDNQITADVEIGPITWSNELVMHVVELKTTQPTNDLESLPGILHRAIQDLTPLLERLHARLLPTAMHPWMNPRVDTVLWPHESHEIYQAYHRLFDCKRHGWANVQSVHLNLPFHGDEEFARLHAAVRLVLPILPALSASSPMVDSAVTGQLDTRMLHYMEHCDAMPSLMGRVVPEAVYNEVDYRREIFAPIAAEVGHTPEANAFELDFLNARGAIARFDRGSIEIRVLDVQECPQADVAICRAVIEVIRSIVAQRWSSLDNQKTMSTETLRDTLQNVSCVGGDAMIDDVNYLAHLGLDDKPVSARDLWRLLLKSLALTDPAIETIQNHGALATRILNAIGDDVCFQTTHAVYQELANCLVENRMFNVETQFHRR